MQQYFFFLLSELSDALKSRPWVHWVSAFIFSQWFKRIKDWKNPTGTSRDDRISVIQRNQSRSWVGIIRMLEDRFVSIANKTILCNSATCERGPVYRNNLISGNGLFSTRMITAISGLSGQAAEWEVLWAGQQMDIDFAHRNLCSVHFTAYQHGSLSVMPLCG